MVNAPELLPFDRETASELASIVRRGASSVNIACFLVRELELFLLLLTNLDLRTLGSKKDVFYRGQREDRMEWNWNARVYICYSLSLKGKSLKDLIY